MKQGLALPPERFSLRWVAEAISCPHCVRRLPGFERHFVPGSAAKCALPDYSRPQVLRSPISQSCEGRRKPRIWARGWSSRVARQDHNLKAAGSNPAPGALPGPRVGLSQGEKAQHQIYAGQNCRCKKGKPDPIIAEQPAEHWSDDEADAKHGIQQTETTSARILGRDISDIGSGNGVLELVRPARARPTSSSRRLGANAKNR